MIKRIVLKISRLVRRTVPAKKPDFGNVRRVCIFKVGAIGDVLMTTPLVKAVSSRFPRAQVDYWVGKWSAPVLKNNPYIDHVIALDEKAVLKRNLLAVHWLAHAIRKHNYDLMFVLDFSYLANLFAAWCRVPVRIGFDRDGEGFPNTLNAPYGKRVHDIDSYLGIAQLIGAKQQSARPEMFLMPAEEHLARAFFKKHGLISGRTIGIAPGGARNPGMTLNSKRWPAKRFAEVAETLTRKGWRVLLLGGPDDKDATAVVKQQVPDAVNAVGMFALRESAALIRQCAYLICNDSGPMHMAAAVRTPVVAIFGPTDPQKLAPRGKKDIALWKHPGKMPCYIDGKLIACDDGHNCIKRITVNDVVRAIR